MPDLSNAQRPKYFVEAYRTCTADLMPSQPNLPLTSRSSKTGMETASINHCYRHTYRLNILDVQNEKKYWDWKKNFINLSCDNGWSEGYIEKASLFLLFSSTCKKQFSIIQARLTCHRKYSRKWQKYWNYFCTFEHHIPDIKQKLRQGYLLSNIPTVRWHKKLSISSYVIGTCRGKWNISPIVSRNVLVVVNRIYLYKVFRDLIGPAKPIT